MADDQLEGDAAEIELGERALVAGLHRAAIDEHDAALGQRAHRCRHVARAELEAVACPGAGACGGQYTANTMSMVMEVIGLSPVGFNSIPQTDPDKHRAAEAMASSGTARTRISQSA